LNIAVISPTAFLDSVGTLTKTHLVLAHIYMESEKYRDFYRNRVAEGDFVILDNSAYELGSSINITDLKHCVEDLKPTATFLPDVRFHAFKTMDHIEKGISILKEYDTMLLAVPQGSDYQQVIMCYHWISGIKEISGFGLYEEIGQVTGFKNRRQFLQHLENIDKVYSDKYYHLLGMEEDLSEIPRLAQFSWVNSIDSAKPVVYGLHGIAIQNINSSIQYPHRPNNYFNIRATTYMNLIRWNIICLQNWANNSQN